MNRLTGAPAFVSQARTAADPLVLVYPDNLAALGVCRALGAQGVAVAVLSSDRGAPGQYSRHARRVPCPPGSDETALVAFLKAFGGAQRQAPVLFLTDDPSLVAIHRHRAELEEWYRFPLAPWSVLRQIMLKDRLYESLEGVVPVPRTRVPANEAELADAAREIGYPALVKPQLRCLAHSASPAPPPFEKCFGAKAIRARTWRELSDGYQAACARGFPVVVQEEIEGPSSSLYSLGLYATRTGTVAATFTSQKLGQVPADFGDGLVVRATRAPELIALGERVIRHFGYYGIADIEFKWDARAKVHKLLDINPRPWLWINLPTACGVNLPYAAYLDAIGRPVDPEAFVQRDFQMRWVSIRSFLVYLVRSLRAGRPFAGLFALLRHARGQRVGPLFSTDDFLFRMLISPAYWRDSVRDAARGLTRHPMLRLER